MNWKINWLLLDIFVALHIDEGKLITFQLDEDVDSFKILAHISRWWMFKKTMLVGALQVPEVVAAVSGTREWDAAALDGKRTTEARRDDAGDEKPRIDWIYRIHVKDVTQSTAKLPHRSRFSGVGRFRPGRKNPGAGGPPRRVRARGNPRVANSF